VRFSAAEHAQEIHRNARKAAHTAAEIDGLAASIAGTTCCKTLLSNSNVGKLFEMRFDPEISSMR
jgi:hypothetical protein